MHIHFSRTIAAIARRFGLINSSDAACASPADVEPPAVAHESGAPPPPQEPLPEAVPEAPVDTWPTWLPNWRKLIDDEKDLWFDGLTQRKHKVLIGTIAGGHPVCTAVESTIAASLTVRGAEVEVLLCDGVLPTCLQCSADQFPDLQKFAEDGPKNSLCGPCYQAGVDAYEPLGLKIRKLSDFLNAEDREVAKRKSASLTLAELEQMQVDGLNLGEHATAGALRFFATGDLTQEEYGLTVARKFAETGILSRLAAQRLFEEGKYDCLFMNHGIYVPHGMIKTSAQKTGTRTAIWEMAARGSCVHLAHEDAVFQLLDEPTEVWENMNWSDAAENELMQYISSRWNGSLDWIYTGMHAGSQTEKDEFEREFGIDFGKPTFGLLTNVIWDAALFYPAMAFPSLVDWMIETIRWFSERPQFNLVIRVHPAEVRGNMPTRQTAQGEIAKVFPQLPANIFIVPPGSKANTYALMSLCDCAIIYGTTTGMELTSVGIPVITAGQAFIKNKGITLDANNREEYFELLDRLPLGKRMTEAQRRRARMYAFNYYFRRSVFLTYAEPVKAWPPIKMNVTSLKQLLPGADLGIDVICDGILTGVDFIYPAEEVALQKARSR